MYIAIGNRQLAMLCLRRLLGHLGDLRSSDTINLSHFSSTRMRRLIVSGGGFSDWMLSSLGWNQTSTTYSMLGEINSSEYERRLRSYKWFWKRELSNTLRSRQEFSETVPSKVSSSYAVDSAT